MHIVARAPNHLGDGVMALPALTALAGQGRLTIQAPRWGPVLYRDLDADITARGPILSGDAAVLFPPSLRVAWEARRVPRRIGIAADWRRPLLTDVVEPGGHRRETYARLARVLGAVAEGDPLFRLHDSDPQSEVPAGHIGLNPVSVSGPVREWRGFAALALQLDRPVVWYGGPGELERVAGFARGGGLKVGLGLLAFANALQRCAVFVSVDTGAAHFARAVGTPTVVVHGSTVASRTGPAGARAVEGPDLHCRPCYKRRCRYNLGCFDIGIERVLREIEVALD